MLCAKGRMAGNERSWFARRAGREDPRGKLIHYLQRLLDVDPARGARRRPGRFRMRPESIPPFTVRAIDLSGLPARASPRDSDLASLSRSRIGHRPDAQVQGNITAS